MTESNLHFVTKFLFVSFAHDPLLKPLPSPTLFYLAHSLLCVIITVFLCFSSFLFLLLYFPPPTLPTFGSKCLPSLL